MCPVDDEKGKGGCKNRVGGGFVEKVGVGHALLEGPTERRQPAKSLGRPLCATTLCYWSCCPPTHSFRLVIPSHLTLRMWHTIHIQK